MKLESNSIIKINNSQSESLKKIRFSKEHKPKTEKIYCNYRNSTCQFQVVRICNIPDYFFERVVAPMSSIFFETIQNARLEIHTSTFITLILSDIISCNQLIEKL